MKTVFFTDKFGITISGGLFLPHNLNSDQKYPCIVISGPAGSVKEQTSGLYALKLSQKGFITLSIDCPFQGQSSGQPRFQEIPAARIESICSAIDYLATLPYADEKKIGALGICVGGGYVASAAMTERRIKAIGLCSPADAGREMRENNIEKTIKKLEEIADLRTLEVRGAEPELIPMIPDEYKTSKDPDHKKAYEYYNNPNRGMVKNWDNKIRLSSMGSVMAFDAFYLAEKLLTQPIQIIVGDIVGAFNAWKDAHTIYDKAASKNKQLEVFKGACHIDLYDNLEYVNKAVKIFDDFFKKFL